MNYSAALKSKFFSRSWAKFADLCETEEYRDVISSLSAFNVWSSLASDVNLHLSDNHLSMLCCKDQHSTEDCCATSKLVKSLERLGGFGNSVKVHVLAQHVGKFAWNHRALGAFAEEGVEKLHRTIKDDIQKVSRSSDLDKLRISLQRWAVQVLLADLGKSSE